MLLSTSRSAAANRPVKSAPFSAPRVTAALPRLSRARIRVTSKERRRLALLSSARLRPRPQAPDPWAAKVCSLETRVSSIVRQATRVTAMRSSGNACGIMRLAASLCRAPCPIASRSRARTTFQILSRVDTIARALGQVNIARLNVQQASRARRRHCNALQVVCSAGHLQRARLQSAMKKPSLMGLNGRRKGASNLLQGALAFLVALLASRGFPRSTHACRLERLRARSPPVSPWSVSLGCLGTT